MLQLTPTHTIKVAAISLLVAGCGPVNTGADGGSDAARADGASGGAVSGTFKVQVILPTMTTAGNTTVVGRVQDGSTPSQIVWTASMQSGDCRLMTPSIPSCTPACGSSAACVAENTCQRYATGLPVGATTINGLRGTAGASPITLTNVANNYQLPAGTTLTYPAFAEGEALTIQAAGEGAIPAFTLTNAGIAPIAVTSANLMVAASTAVNLTWTAPAMTSASQRIKVKLDISHHGGTRGMIACDTATTARSPSRGPRDAPRGPRRRGVPEHRGDARAHGRATVGDGRVNLVTSSDTESYVTVPGVRSCTSNADCMGMGRCREDLTCGADPDRFERTDAYEQHHAPRLLLAARPRRRLRQHRDRRPGRATQRRVDDSATPPRRQRHRRSPTRAATQTPDVGVDAATSAHRRRAPALQLLRHEPPRAPVELSGNQEGFGGDLRFGETGPGAGLRGADKLCAAIAERSMPGAGASSGAPSSARPTTARRPVNAIDRVGNGPWYDRLGRLFANSPRRAHQHAPPGATPRSNDFPNEDGVPNHRPTPRGPGRQPRHAHRLQREGQLYSMTATCLDWTSAAAPRHRGQAPRRPLLAPRRRAAAPAAWRRQRANWMSTRSTSPAARPASASSRWVRRSRASPPSARAAATAASTASRSPPEPVRCNDPHRSPRSSPPRSSAPRPAPRAGARGPDRAHLPPRDATMAPDSSRPRSAAPRLPGARLRADRRHAARRALGQGRLRHASTATLYFQNSTRFQIHYDFVRLMRLSGGARRWCRRSRVQHHRVLLARPALHPRRGHLLRVGPDVWALELSPYDTASAR
jgi:hypothetical protein